MATKNAANIFISIQTLSALYPSNAHQSGDMLPFVTIDDFEASGEGTRDISKATLVAFTPLLKTESDLVTWNAYSANHSDWIARGREFQRDSMFESIHAALDDKAEENGHVRILSQEMEKEQLSEEITKYVYRIDSTGKPVPEDGSGHFAPIWQMSPVPPNPSMVNFNLASNKDFEKLLDFASITGEPILSGPVHAEDFFGPTVSGNGRPVSILLQPVFDDFEHAQDRAIVGTLVAMLHWEEFFNGVRGISVCRTRNIDSEAA
jgi:CHASE domain